MSRPPATDPAAAQRLAAAEWLWSPAGRKAARRELRRFGAPDGKADAEDLLQAVALKVLRVLDRGPLDESAADDAVVAYLNRSLRNEAISVLRSHRRRDLVSLSGFGSDVGDGGEFEPSELTDPVDSFGGVVVADQVDAARRFAGAEGEVEAWVLSAALTRLTFGLRPQLVERARLARSIPLPAGPGDAASWVALAYAGRVTDLPGPDGDDAARRKRRSRALARVDRLLEQVLRDAGEER